MILLIYQQEMHCWWIRGKQKTLGSIKCLPDKDLIWFPLHLMHSQNMIHLLRQHDVVKANLISEDKTKVYSCSHASLTLRLIKTLHFNVYLSRKLLIKCHKENELALWLNSCFFMIIIKVFKFNLTYTPMHTLANVR